jgi:intracellular septation protein
MQLLLDFLPVIAFFAAYKFAGIYVATGVIIVAVVLQVAVTWFVRRQLSPMLLLSAALVLVFGGITLVVHDKAFIMWKPTVLNWLLAITFMLSGLRAFGGRPLIQRLMEATDTELQLGADSWRGLNWIWVLFFAAMGCANLVVFRTFDEATWVNFKLFGMMGLTFVFVLAQGVWIASKSRPDTESNR